MNLGAFSISLAVKDLARSREFYEKLGFTAFGGDGETWQMLRNGSTVLGLFQGMFEKNALTFNPGWDRDGETLAEFTDVREIQRRLKQSGVELITEADESSSGPASLTLIDPDGNPILIDQGSADGFLEEQLKPELFESACAESGQALTLRIQAGYDHSYFFVASFMGDHVAHAAKALS